MIFLSHNKNDKPIVEPIALKLSSVFGEDSVFYDSWSIQPGDGIIDKMSEGLDRMRFFFFFVSRNSLNSNMVKLEWQNALYKAVKGKCRFIPVKLDDCVMPSILMQNLYIDLYNNGLEIGISQMIDVVNGENTFHRNGTEFSNLLCEINQISMFEANIVIKAVHFQEPISKFVLFFQNDSKNLNFELTSDGMYFGGPSDQPAIFDNKLSHYYLIGVNRATTPGFPIRIKVSTKDTSNLVLYSVCKFVDENNFKVLPTMYY